MNRSNTEHFLKTWLLAGKTGLPKVVATEPTYWEKIYLDKLTNFRKRYRVNKYVRKLYGN